MVGRAKVNLTNDDEIMKNGTSYVLATTVLQNNIAVAQGKLTDEEAKKSFQTIKQLIDTGDKKIKSVVVYFGKMMCAINQTQTKNSIVKLSKRDLEAAELAGYTPEEWAAMKQAKSSGSTIGQTAKTGAAAAIGFGADALISGPTTAVGNAARSAQGALSGISCSSCGGTIIPGAKFCPGCGKPTDATTTASTPAASSEDDMVF